MFKAVGRQLSVGPVYGQIGIPRVLHQTHYSHIEGGPKFCKGELTLSEMGSKQGPLTAEMENQKAYI